LQKQYQHLIICD